MALQTVSHPQYISHCHPGTSHNVIYEFYVTLKLSMKAESCIEIRNKLKNIFLGKYDRAFKKVRLKVYH